jgi:hypothetical protein
MHAPFKSQKAEAARKAAEAAAPNPSPHRGLRFYKTKLGKERVQARLCYTDSTGKKREDVGPAHGWGTGPSRKQRCRWHKTKEEAQDAAALDHDNLKNEYEGRGVGKIPTGARAKYFGEFNFPDVINNGRAPDVRRAQPYQVNCGSFMAKVEFCIPQVAFENEVLSSEPWY